ncbi:ATP-grasp domain-containing protein [Pantoea stewartii subsp. indologenes]|uniref:ATP-grasp domain-containing protein n=1 Tax=Pantoea stewartii TaxID=66269 RepID=UPI003FA44A14
MEKRRCLLVLDYLPARINELKNIKDFIKEKYSLEMIIVSDMLSGLEKDFCQYVYHLPISSPNYQDEVLNILASLDMHCVCILPFMDAVSGHAASIADKLGVYGDNADLSFAGIDKLKFREQESSLARFLRAQSITLPQWMKIDNYSMLSDFFKKCSTGVVIKPVDGRANIGVKVVKDENELYDSYHNIREVVPNSTIIAEELIAFDSEFSFDGVGALSFLTQKVCQHGEYPVELGQIVPAQCSPSSSLALIKAGQIINILSGQRYGAFHNEIKLNSETGQTFLVETNRRPAGMRIWDMANRVFGISLQEIWVDYLIQGYSDTLVIPKATGSAFLINLVSPIDGILHPNSIHEEIEEKTSSLVNTLLADYNYEIIQIKINVKGNSRVYANPKTNNDFCGYVCVYFKDEKLDLIQLMNSINTSWQDMMMEEIIID